MIQTIQNAFLRVSVSSMGAELQSVCGNDGTEYLWQGDPGYWTGRAPNLFPYVGRLAGGGYLLCGKPYKMDNHGFTRRSEFALKYSDAEKMTFQLKSSEATLPVYPYNFSFEITYSLNGRSLEICMEVENLDTEQMYFGLGGHPGFRVPLEEGLRYEDYYLRFSQPCKPIRVGFGDTCYRNGQDADYPLTDGQILPLAHELFDQDAIVLKAMAREATLESTKGTHSITVTYPQMPYLGLWHKPKTDAPYLCIEPWVSLPSWENQMPELDKQPDLICLEPGEIYRNVWSIGI